MQPRMVLLGVNIIAASLLIGGLGWVSGEYSLVGIASSLVLFGIVSLVMGFEHREPSMEFLSKYSTLLGDIVLNFLDHLDSVPPLVYSFPRGSKVYVALTRKGGQPVSMDPFIRVYRGRTYVVFDASKILEESHTYIPPDDIEGALNNIVVEEYGLSSRVYLENTRNGYKVMLEEIDSRIIDTVSYPITPSSIFLLAYMAKFTGRKLVLKNEKLIGDSMEVEIEYAGD